MCFVLIYGMFTRLFGANFPVEKIAFVLICTLFINLRCTTCNASVLESFMVKLWDWTHDIGALYKCAMQNRLKVWRKSLEVWLGLESHEFLEFGFCLHVAFAEWLAQLQQVIGSSPEDEQKAHRHSCIATSAYDIVHRNSWFVCTGSFVLRQFCGNINMISWNWYQYH